MGRVELALVVPGRASTPPFYVLPQRVTNAEFLRFAQAQPDRVRGAWQPEGDLGQRAALAPAVPVMGVAWGEAHACAAWLGGELPRVEQLNAAYVSGVCQDAVLEGAEEWSQPNPRPDLREGLPNATFRVVVPAPRSP
jgi:formylglycine-generating enzyme required for sulfatase activity